MRIKEIVIKNFRGFENKHFEFNPQMNVVLGDNTSGKTTLLHAVQIALGAYLQSMTLLPGGKPYRRNFREMDYARTYSEANRSFLRIQEKPEIQVTAECFYKLYNQYNKSLSSNLLDINWTKLNNTISKKNARELIDIVSNIEHIRIHADETGQNAIFPLLLSFGANRLEKNYRAAKKTKAKESTIERAYKCALEEEVDFQSAFDWIYRFEKNFDKGFEFEGTDFAFIETIKTAIPAIKDIDIDRKNSELSAQIQMSAYPHPKWLTYNMMSDGFKAMINIVAEMAYRCIQLNGFLGVQAVKETPGVVLIDELDLYLHPHWQHHVLADLQSAFPLIQFIVTTHSPFIVQSVQSKNVITLDTELNLNKSYEQSFFERS